MAVQNATSKDQSKHYWIASRVAYHLKALSDDIEDNLTATPEVFRPLAGYGVTCARSCSTALDEYFLSGDSEKLQKELMLACLDFTQQWESWLDNIHSGDLKFGASKVFHSMLLRFVKGCLKYWRIWRIDIQK